MKRSSKTGFLFFLLLQMSLLSKVWPVDPVTEAITESARTTDQTTNPGSTSGDQMSSISTSSNTMSTSVNSTVSTVNMTSNSSSVTGNYSMVSCPAFVCTTDCSVQLMNATVNPCPSSSSFCEVMKQNTSYSVSCSASCGMSCGNTTTVNCSWKCCNTTNCINDTVLALNNLVSTTVATTSIATTTTTKATVPVTQANNGKKCHNIKCDGAACYKPSNTVMLCPVGQDYCMLKKTTTGSTESWLGGCSDDCRKMAVCSASVTTCYLECCNATSSASCLKLTGDVNMPSSATRGPHSPALLMASLLLFWIVRVFT